MVRAMLMPVSRASTRFPPIAYAWRPNTVIWVTTSRMTTAATQTTSINGMPLAVLSRSSGNRTTPITMRPGMAAPATAGRRDRSDEGEGPCGAHDDHRGRDDRGTAPRPRPRCRAARRRGLREDQDGQRRIADQPASVTMKDAVLNPDGQVG